MGLDECQKGSNTPSLIYSCLLCTDCTIYEVLDCCYLSVETIFIILGLSLQDSTPRRRQREKATISSHPSKKRKADDSSSLNSQLLVL